MPLETDVKQQIVSHFQRSENDTGSPEVQVALMTQRIRDLTEHLKRNRHDFHSRNGLFRLNGQRRKLLNYLKRKDLNRYRTLIQELGLRK